MKLTSTHPSPATTPYSRPILPQYPPPPDAKSGRHQVKKHGCNVCLKLFSRPSALASHMSVHTGTKPYQCPTEGCGRRFSVSSNMRRHMRGHNAAPTLHDQGELAESLQSYHPVVRHPLSSAARSTERGMEYTTSQQYQQLRPRLSPSTPFFPYSYLHPHRRLEPNLEEEEWRLQQPSTASGPSPRSGACPPAHSSLLPLVPSSNDSEAPHHHHHPQSILEPVPIHLPLPVPSWLRFPPPEPAPLSDSPCDAEIPSPLGPLDGSDSPCLAHTPLTTRRPLRPSPSILPLITPLTPAPLFHHYQAGSARQSGGGDSPSKQHGGLAGRARGRWRWVAGRPYGEVGGSPAGERGGSEWGHVAYDGKVGSNVESFGSPVLHGRKFWTDSAERSR